MGRDSIEKQGKKYISAKRAAAEFGYTTDYIGQLARGGKIDATLVGRSWYVTESSLENHRVLRGEVNRRGNSKHIVPSVSVGDAERSRRSRADVREALILPPSHREHDRVSSAPSLSSAAATRRVYGGERSSAVVSSGTPLRYGADARPLLPTLSRVLTAIRVSRPFVSAHPMQKKPRVANLATTSADVTPPTTVTSVHVEESQSSAPQKSAYHLGALVRDLGAAARATFVRRELGARVFALAISIALIFGVFSFVTDASVRSQLARGAEQALVLARAVGSDATEAITDPARWWSETQRRMNIAAVSVPEGIKIGASTLVRTVRNAVSRISSRFVALFGGARTAEVTSERYAEVAAPSPERLVVIERTSEPPHGTLELNSDVAVRNRLDVLERTSVGGELVVEGSGGVRGGLSVSGRTVLSGALSVGGAATVGSTLTVSGDTTLGDTIIGGLLSANGESEFRGAATFAAPTTFDDAAAFNAPATFLLGGTFLGPVAALDGIATEGADIDLGTGKLTASNVVYTIQAGSNITISGSPQSPVISAEQPIIFGGGGGVREVQGERGTVTFLGGTDISISGLTISNISTLSSVRGRGGCTGCVTDADVVNTLTVDGGTVNATPIGDTRVSTALFSQATSSIFAATSSAYFATESGRVGIGTTTPATTLSVAGNLLIGTTTATSTIEGGLRISGGGLSISTMNCTGFTGGGQLTTDASGNIICGNEVGGVISGWTDDGVVVRLNTQTDHVSVATTSPDVRSVLTLTATSTTANVSNLLTLKVPAISGGLSYSGTPFLIQDSASTTLFSIDGRGRIAGFVSSASSTID
ncbi:MAG: hypothetical protein Q8R39_03795, partial [bacterium]|nr:hypothetical protein [bacterium]MDZ4284377.1 hypothetical protein [Patescibacteria group bacterium]